MGRADQILYSSARRILRKFHTNEIPFTGPVGTDLICWNLDPVSCLKTWFRHPGPVRFEEGAKLLERIESQLAVLEGCEETTREALSEWAALAAGWRPSGQHARGHPHSDTFFAAAACEDGMNLLGAQIDLLMDPLGLENSEESASRAQRTEHSIEQLAAAVRSRDPSLFASNNSQQHQSGDSIVDGESKTIEKLHILSDVLYKEIKLKYEPFEWVYDGLKPLLLPDVLESKKGTPAALAIAAAAVGRRVGIPLLPLPAAAIEAGAGGSGANADLEASLEKLSPELALRVSTRTQAVAPGPGPWVLRLDTLRTRPSHFNSVSEDYSSSGKDSPSTAVSSNNSKSHSDGAPGHYLDAGNGTVFSTEQLEKEYPDIADVSLDIWRQRSVLATWQGLSRLAIQAHQRRGESDHVAHWMYIALSLDPQAPEWERALTQSEL